MIRNRRCNSKAIRAQISAKRTGPTNLGDTAKRGK